MEDWSSARAGVVINVRVVVLAVLPALELEPPPCHLASTNVIALHLVERERPVCVSEVWF